jgi:phosphotransferase system enzyme I (PtsI)
MLKGTGISDGIGLGKAIIFKSQKIKLEKNKIKDVTLEKEKFYKAIKEVEKEIENLLEKISGTEKEIMQAYLLILQDPNLIQKTIEIIEKEKWDAAYATEIGFNEIIKEFEKVDDTYISERSKDIEDMKKKIIAKIIGKEEINLSKLPSNTILVAKELSTSDIAKLDFKNIEGIITEVGGMNSHMAIMARTHEIPSSVGVNKITQNIKQNDVVAINGKTGEIFVNPSKKEYKNFEEIKEKIKKEKNELENYKNQDTITKDGHEVKVLANIGMPDDVKIVIQNTAEGVGLFRSEFLYMNSENFPTENEQFEAYKKVVLKLKNKEVIIRTLDIGGDKDLKYMKLPKEDNPFLGYRAIRICLDDINLFKVQLRAILKASAFGNMAIMIPMISSLEELRKTKEIINEVKEELRKKKIKFDENIKIGIMIEIPAAALIADELAKECDFFSIGTNDLIQYTVAVERGNKKIANLYTHFHPAVIRLIKKAIEGAHKNHILCGMCGEAAGDVTFIPLLIGLGLDEFSMNANKVLNVRKLIRKLDFKECQKLADEVLKLATSDEVEKLLVKYTRGSN